MTEVSTRVAIVGAGPAGLLLSQLLSTSGVEHIVVEARSHEEILTTQRAGILEEGTVAALAASGAPQARDHGDRHGGIYLRFDGEMHHIDFSQLVGASVYLYPQTKVYGDLAALAMADGRDVRWDSPVEYLDGIDGERPRLRVTPADEAPYDIVADIVIAADGSHSTCRQAFPEDVRRTYSYAYPYAWFGVIIEAPRSCEELVYADSDRGFALISQRTPTHQRMYFQCDPDDDADEWSEERIWDEFRARIAGRDDFALREGPIVERAVLRFRSSVVTPTRMGRVVLVGDAAHTVPPTGAKGLNLAIADVVLLHELLLDWLRSGDDELLDEYGRRSAHRVWRAQHYSAWMSRMLHATADESEFERERRRAELRTVVESKAGRTWLAEGYTGWGEIR